VRVLRNQRWVGRLSIDKPQQFLDLPSFLRVTTIHQYFRLGSSHWNAPFRANFSLHPKVPCSPQQPENSSVRTSSSSVPAVASICLRAIRSSIARCEPRYRRLPRVRPCGLPLRSGTSSPSAVAELLRATVEEVYAIRPDSRISSGVEVGMAL